MKATCLMFLLLFSLPGFAQTVDRYVQEPRVTMERPRAQDVLKVNTAIGFCTVLEFPDKPLLVSLGDSSIIDVEVPKGSNSIIIKPLQSVGETNLFVFTSSQRFNYKVTVGDASQVDYVLSAKDVHAERKGHSKNITLDQAIKMARGYEFFKTNRLIDEQDFVQRKLFFKCSYPKASIDVIEAFSNNDPHLFIVHIVVHNPADQPITLTEQNTFLSVGARKFTPQYVLFDSDKLAAHEKTDGWLVLSNNFVSLDNPISVILGVEDQAYECHQSIS